MDRKHDPESINLKIEGMKIFQWKEDCYYGAIVIQWGSDVGFGEYTVRIKEDGSIEGDPETMDSNDDKRFLKKLLELLLEKVQIK